MKVPRISRIEGWFILSLILVSGILAYIYYEYLTPYRSDVIKAGIKLINSKYRTPSNSELNTVTGDKVNEEEPVSSFLLNQEIKGATVIKRSQSAWSRDDESCYGDQRVVKTELRSPAGNTPIYIHPSTIDNWISGSIQIGGIWEQGTVTKLYRILKDRPDLQFIDIGANIGVYGLTMARLGRKVIMVEPLLTNVQKLCHSVRDGSFQNVYVVHNAMSSKRFKVGFGVYVGNIGGTYVRNITSDTEETAYAILLDDLLGVFHFTKVAIKLDVETHEGSTSLPM